MNLNQILKLMDRKKNSKKGENGSVLIIGGSEQNVGGITLAGLAALRAGCDIVTIAAPEKVAWTINRTSSDLLTIKIKGQFTVKLAKEMVKLAERYDVVLLGNGITKKPINFAIILSKKHPGQKLLTLMLCETFLLRISKIRLLRLMKQSWKLCLMPAAKISCCLN